MNFNRRSGLRRETKSSFSELKIGLNTIWSGDLLPWQIRKWFGEN
jgi:hypothetical protein